MWKVIHRTKTDDSGKYTVMPGLKTETPEGICLVNVANTKLTSDDIRSSVAFLGNWTKEEKDHFQIGTGILIEFG